MLIRDVRLEHFRNLSTQDVAFHPRLTVITGDNGQGKTNLLEAIYLLAALRSFRTPRLGECIAWDSDAARVVGQVERLQRRPRIEVRLAPGVRRVIVDGKPLRSTREYQGDLNAVLFTPEDLLLARGSPELRRRFLDRGVFTAAPAHLADVLDYERALRSRNALLKLGTGTGPEGEAHAATLARLGARVIARRLAWIRALRPSAAAIFRDIAALESPAGMRYDFSIDALSEESAEEEIALALGRHWERSLATDLARGYTCAGPHADDLGLSLGERPLRVAGSQGQQRAFVLSLKLAEIRHVEASLGEPPVLLLDDVGSELDAMRREHLFRHLDEVVGQVIVTTTAPALIPMASERTTYRAAAGHLFVEW